MSSQNIYDNIDFYKNYLLFSDTFNGIQSYYEWNYLTKLFPNFKDIKYLELGCGQGSLCILVSQSGAKEVLGIDISKNMINDAIKINKEKNNNNNNIKFEIQDLEILNLDNKTQYDLIFSRFVIHYIVNIERLFNIIYNSLNNGGEFIFVIEHPIKTSSKTFNNLVEIQINQNELNKKKVWPLHDYEDEGIRIKKWLNIDNVCKQHRTVSTYLNLLIKCGFTLNHIDEILPKKEELDKLNNKFKSDYESIFILIIKAIKK